MSSRSPKLVPSLNSLAQRVPTTDDRQRNRARNRGKGSAGASSGGSRGTRRQDRWRRTSAARGASKRAKLAKSAGKSPWRGPRRDGAGGRSVHVRAGFCGSKELFSNPVSAQNSKQATSAFSAKRLCATLGHLSCFNLALYAREFTRKVVSRAWSQRRGNSRDAQTGQSRQIGEFGGFVGPASCACSQR